MAEGSEGLKIFAVISIFILTILSGLAPVYFKNTVFLNTRMISIGNCATAGIFLAMSLSHILYEAKETEIETGYHECFAGRLHLHLFLGTFIGIFTIECLISKSHIHEKPLQSLEGSPVASASPAKELQDLDIKSQSRDPLIERREGNKEPSQDFPKLCKHTFTNFILVTAAMSIHSMSAGLALGVQKTYQSVMSMLIGRLLPYSKPSWLTSRSRQLPLAST